jgi:hypothetical protein
MIALLALPAVFSLLAPAARAAGQEPGSLLIYPEYDNRPGQFSLLTITNTNGDTQSGAIKVHFIFVNASNCLETDLIFNLTARDTVSFISNVYTSANERGYAYGWAVDPLTGKAVDFDHLIGSLLRVDGARMIDWSVQALVFQGRPGAGLDTDVDHDGRRDLDGIEYDKAPNKIYVPRFYGQSSSMLPGASPSSDLILFRPLGPTNSSTTAAFLVWNDNEEVFSASYTFTCWTRQPLLNYSGAFSQTFLSFTNGAPNEIIGMNTTDAGWFEVRGAVATATGGQTTANPPIFGVLVEQRPQSAADLPFVEDL